MADKDAAISVASNGSISVNPTDVRVKKNQDQVKWSCSNASVQRLTVAFKDGSYTLTLTQKNDGTWEGKSKHFDAEGTFPYDIVARVGGVDHSVDPSVIVDP